MSNSRAPLNSDTQLVASLRQLCAHAERGGADRAWLDRVADDLVALILDRQDPRRRRSHAQAAQMAIAVQSMRQAGHSNGQAVAALCRRHGIGRSWAYELLKLSGNNAGRKRR